jgi:hypothetical protein
VAKRIVADVLGAAPSEIAAAIEVQQDTIWGRSWEDRKRRWAAVYPLVAKGIADSFEGRALELVQPPGPADKLEKWREQFLSYAEMLKRERSVAQYSSAERKKLLGKAADALEEALAKLNELPPGYGNAPTRGAIASEAARLRGFEAATRVARSGGPQDPDQHLKILAADYAFDLLNDYVEAPTQSNDGKYFNLASLLFEAATDRADVSIARQCKAHIERLRGEVGSDDAFRVRRKRTDLA